MNTQRYNIYLKEIEHSENFQNNAPESVDKMSAKLGVSRVGIYKILDEIIMALYDRYNKIRKVETIDDKKDNIISTVESLKQILAELAGLKNGDDLPKETIDSLFEEVRRSVKRYEDSLLANASQGEKNYVKRAIYYGQKYIKMEDAAGSAKVNSVETRKKSMPESMKKSILNRIL